MKVSYRFADVVERAVSDFCARALPDAELPEGAAYTVCDEMALDAYVDGVECMIDLPDGYVSLSLAIALAAWVTPDTDEWDPVVYDLRADRVVHGEGSDVEYVWDDEASAWSLADREA